MPEYIERDAFLDYMKGTSRYFNVKFDIENFPAADAVPVVHGRWLDNEDYMFCSICGIQWNYCDNDTETFNYCPNCGAKMDGEDTHE